MYHRCIIYNLISLPASILEYASYALTHTFFWRWLPYTLREGRVAVLQYVIHAIMQFIDYTALCQLI